MLNENKVILMTKMASYEKHEGKKNMKIGSYFRGDYVAVQVLKSVFCATVSYALILALYIFYHFEKFMQDIYKMDLVAFAKDILLYYLVTAAVYGVITYCVCTYRYIKARKSMRTYYQNLKKLSSMYKDS